MIWHFFRFLWSFFEKVCFKIFSIYSQKLWNPLIFFADSDRELWVYSKNKLSGHLDQLFWKKLQKLNFRLKSWHTSFFWPAWLGRIIFFSLSISETLTKSITGGIFEILFFSLKKLKKSKKGVFFRFFRLKKLFNVSDLIYIAIFELSASS